MSIELTYLPQCRVRMEVCFRHKQVAAQHTGYRCTTQCPLLMRCTHINNRILILETLLLSDSCTRHEANIATLVILEACLLHGVSRSECTQVRQFRIRLTILHLRNNDLSRSQRNETSIRVDRIIQCVYTNPVLSIVPLIVFGTLRIPA